MRRSGSAGFRRNVAVALGNWGWPVPVLVAALSDAEPLVRSHSVWALRQINSVSARAAVAALTHEGDDAVRAEFHAVLCPTSGTSRGPQLRRPE